MLFIEPTQISVLALGAAFGSWRYNVGSSGVVSRGRVSLDIVVRDGFSDKRLLVLDINIIRRDLMYTDLVSEIYNSQENEQGTLGMI